MRFLNFTLPPPPFFHKEDSLDTDRGILLINFFLAGDASGVGTVSPEAHAFIDQTSGVEESMKVFAYYYVGLGCAVLLTGYVRCGIIHCEFHSIKLLSTPCKPAKKCSRLEQSSSRICGKGHCTFGKMMDLDSQTSTRSAQPRSKIKKKIFSKNQFQEGTQNNFPKRAFKSKTHFKIVT